MCLKLKHQDICKDYNLLFVLILDCIAVDPSLCENKGVTSCSSLNQSTEDCAMHCIVKEQKQVGFLQKRNPILGVAKY